MTTSPNKQPLRLRKKHAPTEAADASVADGARLAAAQSLRNAFVASLIGIVVFSVLSVMITRVTDRAFPWMTVLLGAFIGYLVQRAGHGIDWRFPVLAAIGAAAGAFVSNFIIAASYTGESMGVSTLEVLRAVTSMTWPVYFNEVITVADYVYAACAAALAAFFAPRRLSRAEYRAVRLFKESL